MHKTLIIKKLFFGILGFLFVFNAGYFVIKNLQIYSSLDQRNQDAAFDFIQKHIPQKSRVIGEPMFFYAVTLNHSDYQYFDLYENIEDREKILRENYNYQYLIVTDYSARRNPNNIAQYFAHARLEKIGRLELPQNQLNSQINQFKIFGLRLVSDTEQNGYSCTLYKRIIDNEELIK